MNYDSLLKDIGDATALRQLIDAKRKEHGAVDSQITANEKEMARLVGLKRNTDLLIANRGSLLKGIAELNAELNKRMEKLNKEGVELPIQESGSKATVSL